MKKIIKKISGAIFEGAIQSVPGGNAIIKIVIALLKRFGIIKDGKGMHVPNWTAITVEVILISAIVYSFLTKAITLDELIVYVSEFSPND